MPTDASQFQTSFSPTDFNRQPGRRRAKLVWIGISGEFAGRPSTQIVQIDIDTRRTVSSLDRNLFGSFLEHLGRAIYEGIYEPNSKFADSNGYRKDVLEEVRKLNVPIIRYPGGNFVSGYHWLDGVGPKQDRPKVLEKAWNSIESNQFGINEFLGWCKLAATTPLLGLNLGTGTPEWLQRSSNIATWNRDEVERSSPQTRCAEPINVKNWCLGNEMDGPWQIGHMSAAEYGEKAADAARQMRYVDPSLSLIACGSSSIFMPTYLQWDHEVLNSAMNTWTRFLFIVIMTTRSETGGDSSKFLAMNLSMERQISEVAAVCEYVRGRKRSPKNCGCLSTNGTSGIGARTGAAVNGSTHGSSAPARRNLQSGRCLAGWRTAEHSDPEF